MTNDEDPALRLQLAREAACEVVENCARQHEELRDSHLDALEEHPRCQKHSSCAVLHDWAADQMWFYAETLADEQLTADAMTELRNDYRELTQKLLLAVLYIERTEAVMFGTMRSH